MRGTFALCGVILLASCGGGSGATADGQGAAAPPAFAQCRTCHALQPGRNGVGPSLAGIAGRKAGSAPGFNFSPALRETSLVWDGATLDRFLANPGAAVPGTRMVIAVPDPAARKAIIAYLLSADGKGRQP